MWTRIDLTGKKYGRWTVLGLAHLDKRKRSYYFAECECGNQKIVLGCSMSAGYSKSCGCLMRERAKARYTTHGMHKHPAHKCWMALRQRCNNPNATGYKDYGGRGIKVCARWLESFENFWADMGPTWQEGYSIDRKKVDGDYEPDNCRWATAKQQQRNRRVCRYIETPEGRMTVTDAGERFGVPRRVIFSRLHQGWPEHRLLEKVQEAVPSDLMGRTFGKWEVTGLVSRHYRRNGGNLWACRCVCGTDRSVLETSLVNGRSRSCGCAKIRSESGAFVAVH